MVMFRPKSKKLHVNNSDDIVGISKNLLLDIIETAKSKYPNEFGAVLRKNSRGIISEMLILPGTISGHKRAEFKFYMMHVDFNTVGTVHSHPSPYPIPSSADSELFSRFGKCHIIIAYPYDLSSWIAYDRNSNRISVGIIEDL